MNSGRQYQPIKENRRCYFIEYYPPMMNAKYATLYLVIVEDIPKTEIARAMENELRNWLNRYPIPLFVTAFDNKGDLYNLHDIKPCNHLIGFFDQAREVKLHWRLLKDDEIPDVALDQEYVDNLYSDLVFETDVNFEAERRNRQRQIKMGWLIVFFWLVVIPLVIALLDYFSDLVSLIALVISFCIAIKKALELTGKWPKSKRKKEQELEDRLKNHYYFHCQMNPEGFNRLKIENFEKMAKDDVIKEAESLKSGKQ